MSLLLFLSHHFHHLFSFSPLYILWTINIFVLFSIFLFSIPFLFPLLVLFCFFLSLVCLIAGCPNEWRGVRLLLLLPLLLSALSPSVPPTDRKARCLFPGDKSGWKGAWKDAPRWSFDRTISANRTTRIRRVGWPSTCPGDWLSRLNVRGHEQPGVG